MDYDYLKNHATKEDREWFLSKESSLGVEKMAELFNDIVSSEENKLRKEMDWHKESDTVKVEAVIFYLYIKSDLQKRFVKSVKSQN